MFDGLFKWIKRNPGWFIFLLIVISIVTIGVGLIIFLGIFFIWSLTAKKVKEKKQTKMLSDVSSIFDDPEFEFKVNSGRKSILKKKRA